MSAFRDQVADALRAVRVTSPTTYAWFGRPSPPVRRELRSSLDAAAARGYLVARLAQDLYRLFYLLGMPRPHAPDDALPDGADLAFVATLSSANTSTGGWAGGWRVVETADAGGALVAERDGLLLRIDAGDHRPAGHGFVSARLPRELRAASPGFYVARGNAGVGAGDAAAVELRVYFNITPAGAPALVAAATRLLNEQRLAFSIKLVSHPARYARCDAGVLYLQAGDLGPARAPLRELVAAVSPHLHAEVPALTKPLARGVGVGEHRADLGLSFGLGRCQLLAEAIADAHEQRVTGLVERVDAVARRFAAQGLDLDRPYLVPGSGDDYVL